MKSGLRTTAIIALGIAAATAFVAAGGLWGNLGSSLRADALDQFFPRGRTDERVAVVVLDRKFTRVVENDPISGYNDLVDRLILGGARTGLPTTDMLEATAAQVTTATDRSAFEDAVAEVFRAAGNIVLSLPRGRLSAPRSRSSIPTLDRAIPNSVLANAAVATGAGELRVEGSADPSRTVPLIVELAGRAVGTQQGRRSKVLVPAISALAFVRAEDLDATVRERSGGLELDGRLVPTEGRQQLRVNYADKLLPGGDQVFLASDVLADKVRASHFRDKTVLLGVTDPAYAEFASAPVGPDHGLPAVFIHANALNTTLTGQFIHPVSGWTTVMGVALLAFIVALVVLVLPIWLTPVPAVLLAGAWWLLARQRFDAGHPVDLVYPLAAIVAAFVGAFIWRAAVELRERRRVAAMFSQYVPGTVAKELLEPGQAERAAAGQRLHIAILFCDLRGFTALSATMEPGDVRELLDVYYERVSQIVLDRGGTVMRFVGDEVLAVFGAPLPMPDHVAVSLRCAMEILAATEALHAELAAKDLPPIEFGIGLHCGEVICAHVGSSAHRQYDLVGDAANIGARLCSEAGRRELVTSGEVISAAALEVDAEAMGVLELNGVSARIEGYRLRAGEASTTTGGVASPEPRPSAR